MAADLFALYLRSYMATLTPTGSDGYAYPATAAGVSDGVPEIMAIALGIEDGLRFKNNTTSETDEDDPPYDAPAIHGYRPRWRVLEIIDEWNAAEQPPEGEDD